MRARRRSGLDIIDRWRNLPPVPPPTYDVIFMGETVASDLDERGVLEAMVACYEGAARAGRIISAPYAVVHVPLDPDPNP